MADVPPFFEDLGKSARDVFNKGFGKDYKCSLVFFLVLFLCLRLTILIASRSSCRLS